MSPAAAERPPVNAQRLVTGSASRWNIFEEHCGIVNASLGDVSKRIAGSDHFSRDEKMEYLQQMKACAQQLAQIDSEARARVVAAKEIAAQLESEQRTGEPLEDFLGLFQRGSAAALDATGDSSARRPRALGEVEALLAQVSGGEGDDDVQVALGSGGSQHVSRCPILGCELINPVKSSECGHVYSTRGAISLLFQSNSRGERRLPDSLDQVPRHFSANCPYAMCSKRISPDELVRDYATELTQRQMQSSARRESGTDEVELL